MALVEGGRELLKIMPCHIDCILAAFVGIFAYIHMSIWVVCTLLLLVLRV